MKERSQMETILRVWDAEQIKDLMSRRAMYSSNEERERELNELWVTRPENRETASFGRNYGYYVGMDAIRSYYVDAHRARVARCGGVGCMEAHAVSSPYLILAEDGQTARGLWYSIGHETYPGSDGGLTPLWVMDKVAADFIKEDGAWKIWHLILSNDVWNPASVPMDALPDKLPEEMDWVKEEFGHPTVEMKTHEPLYLWSDNYPPMPEPYETYDPRHSYAPEGHPNYRKEALV